jgi:hypothetical protein
MCPSGSDGPYLLCLRQLPFRVLILQTSRSLATCSLQWTVAIFFDLRDFRILSHSTLEILRSDFPEVLDLSTCVSWKPTTWIYFGLRLFNNFDFSLSKKLPNCFHSRVVDIMPLLPLDDGRFLSTSGLR